MLLDRDGIFAGFTSACAGLTKVYIIDADVPGMSRALMARITTLNIYLFIDGFAKFVEASATAFVCGALGMLGKECIVYVKRKKLIPKLTRLIFTRKDKNPST